MSMTRWIGTEHDTFTAGQTGFLVEISHNLKGWTRHELRDHPPKTNQSFKPMLYGWCGTFNDVATYGKGMAVVTRVAKNGRALVRELTGDELSAALDDFGYPDLMEQAEDRA